MDVQSESWQVWSPERLIRAFSPNEIRYSKGFLQLAIEELFPALKAHWLPLFHALGGTIQFQLIEKGFELPSGLKREFVVEFDGDPAIVGLDTRAERSLAQAVVPGAQGPAVDIVLNYLERRLLFSLTKSWSGAEPLVCLHTSATSPDKIVGNRRHAKFFEAHSNPEILGENEVMAAPYLLIELTLKALTQVESVRLRHYSVAA